MKLFGKEMREGNRFEAKAAVGGLPRSLWETYSAFANSDGGEILLGVEERPDKTLHVVGIEHPNRLVKEFWDTVNNQSKVNLNILSDRDVIVENAEGKKIVRIMVPRAERSERPIFLNRDMLGGTFRRNGEGDYRCSKEEVRAMLRDAESKSMDLQLVGKMGVGVLNADTIHRYRNRMQSCRPGHVWQDLDDEPFLIRLGALAHDDAGTLRPTRAGLLMFGNEYDIVLEFHDYFLDYQERLEEGVRWSDRIVSSSGEWSGNIYDFYFRVYNRISQTLTVPFRIKGSDRIDDTPIHQAVREALVNCLVNADYDLPRGVVVVRNIDGLVMSNPGGFRIPIATAMSGGISDPRNATLLKMFTLIDIGERSGHGIPMIDASWRAQNWPAMQCREEYAPERTTIELQMPNKKFKTRKVAIKSGDKKAAIKSGDNGLSAIGKAHWAIIKAYLAEHDVATSRELADVLKLGASRVREFLGEMIARGSIVSHGANRNRVYRLKEC